jgi:HlyD family secretion protein
VSVKNLGRWLKRGLIVLVAILVLFVIVRAWLPKPVSVEWAEAARGPMQVTVDEDGQSRVEDRYVVSAPLSGSLARIELEPGDLVKQADTVARIVPLPPPLLDVRTRETTQAQLAAALASQKQVASQIERARASLELAKTDAARDRTLFARGAISRQELEQSLLRERTAAAELESARFGSRVASHEAEMARAALRHLSAGKRDESEQLMVPAPVSGRVLRIQQKSEGVVQAGTPLLEIGDPAALEIVVDVLTSDAVRIRPGARVIVDRWGGAALDGRVKRIEPSAFTRVSALGVEEQRVNVRIGLVDAKDKWASLGDGYRVEAKIVVWESADVVKVPASSIFRHDGSWALYAIEDGKARLTRIEVGERTPREVQSESGLEPGARVVIHPSDAVKDGTPVEPR